MSPDDSPLPVASQPNHLGRERPEFMVTPCPGGFELTEDGTSRGRYRTEAFAAAAAVTAAQDRGVPGYVIYYP